MTWREISDLPAAPASALVAVRADDGEPFLLPGVYLFRRGAWANEDTGEPLDIQAGRPAWWIDESALFAVVPLPQFAKQGA